MEKKFDCVKMVREIRDKHYEETKNMTREERIKYIKEKAKALDAKLKTKTKV
jgi:hypothetical protein